MKNLYFSPTGSRMSRARWFALRDRLYMKDRFNVRNKTGKDVHHIVSVEYWDEGLFFIVDKLIPGKLVYPYAKTHYRAYIHARHSH